MIPPFQTIFAVHLSCDSCVKDVSDSLYRVNGINTVTASLPNQTVSITGTAPPSAIVAAIQSTGRDAILRGSGVSDSAAVCILETHAPAHQLNPVRGLARMVQVSPGLTLIDLTIRGLRPGTYHATIRNAGDVSRGAASMGGIWGGIASIIYPGKKVALSPSVTNGETPPAAKKGVLGTIEVSKGGTGSAFLEKPVEVWEMIGRGMIVSRKAGQEKDAFDGAEHDEDTIVGVVARSAGVWDNDKTMEAQRRLHQAIQLARTRLEARLRSERENGVGGNGAPSNGQRREGEGEGPGRSNNTPSWPQPQRRPRVRPTPELWEALRQQVGANLAGRQRLFIRMEERATDATWLEREGTDGEADGERRSSEGPE
ncbi:copper chaperone [Loxospora ochrophaea]|nr:copper chaperone [Loxospora ochrophaea]